MDAERLNSLKQTLGESLVEFESTYVNPRLRLGFT